MHRRRPLAAVPLAIFVAAALAQTPARAQCTLRFHAGMGIPGIDGPDGPGVIAVMTWDSDGPGSLPPLLVIAGKFTEAGTVRTSNIAAYDPATGDWSAFGTSTNGNVLALAVAANGDLIAGGMFTAAGGVAANRVARWNGTAWSPLGAGCDGPVTGLSAMPDGDVVLNGTFLLAGGGTSARLARVSTTCRATATGMPALAVVLSLYGFTPVSIPLASVLPQGLPGCNMYTLPDFIEVLLPSAGAVHTRLAVPDTVALAGLVVHHHVVPFEVNPALQVLAITSSNALRLTLGSF